MSPHSTDESCGADDLALCAALYLIDLFLFVDMRFSAVERDTAIETKSFRLHGPKTHQQWWNGYV